MKYLFIVQGEGRGHLTQAIALANMLRRNGHQVAEVLLGESKAREVPTFFKEKVGCPISEFPTFSFLQKKDNKQVHLLKSILFNAKFSQLKKYKQSIEFIRERIEDVRPDVVICFYETLSSIARLRYKLKVPFINIGHQFLQNHPDYQFGQEGRAQLLFFKLYNYLNIKGSLKNLALSFYPMKDCSKEKICVVPPLLREEVLSAKPKEKDHILVYMLNTGYEEEIREWHKKNKTIKLSCFWDKKGVPEEWKIDETLTFYTINDEKFIEQMTDCKGYISTAGFESICEAFYMKKPVMMIPAHVEQEVNAADASSTGYGIADTSFDIDKLIAHIDKSEERNDYFKIWVDSAEQIFMHHLTAV